MTNSGRVLLVDDDTSTLNAIQRLLYRELAVITVSNGSAALALMRKELFAVVVTDLTMPGMSGFELLSTLETEFPETVCIVLSGQMEGTFPIRMAQNVFRRLAKPCCTDDLVAAIHGAFAEYVLRLNVSMFPST